MTQALFDVLRGYSDFCTIISDELPNNAGVISIVPLTMSPAELDTYLAQNGICVRSGLHCAPLAHKQMKTAHEGTVRFSMGCFNTDKEIKYLSHILEDLQ